MPDEERIVCKTPTPGKRPTRIHRQKYDAILDILSGCEDGVEFRNLPSVVNSRLSEDQRSRLGSVSRYITCVKLDMEVKGDIHRVAGARPQRLRLSDSVQTAADSDRM